MAEQRPQGWTVAPLGELAEWLSGGTPKTTEPSYWNGEIPWITSGSLTSFHLHESDRRLTELGVRNGSRLVPKGSIIFVVRGMSLKSEFRIGIASRPLAFGQDCKALIARTGVDSLFLAQAIRARSSEVLAMVEEAGHGTGRLATDRIKSLSIMLPALSEQRAIAEVVGALDDKIETNERLHHLCHGLASALLARTLDIAESDDTLKEVRLGDVAEVNARKVAPGVGMLRYLDIAAVGVGRADEATVMEWAAAPGRARRAVKDGDVIWSTVRPNRRSHCLLLDPEPDLVVSTGFAVLTSLSVGPSFLYGVTERSEFIDYLVTVAEGSAYPAVRAERFLEALIPLPPRDALDSFEELTMPLRSRARAALNESRKLAALRDALLLPLLSGELRVRDAEVLVGEAV